MLICNKFGLFYLFEIQIYEFIKNKYTGFGMFQLERQVDHIADITEFIINEGHR